MNIILQIIVWLSTVTLSWLAARYLSNRVKSHITLAMAGLGTYMTGAVLLTAAGFQTPLPWNPYEGSFVLYVVATAHHAFSLSCGLFSVLLLHRQKVQQSNKDNGT